jgi:hypothetical protein
LRVELIEVLGAADEPDGHQDGGDQHRCGDDDLRHLSSCRDVAVGRACG